MANKEQRRHEVRGILAELANSGLSQREFAEREGISTSTLAYWIRRDKLEREIQGESALVAIQAPPESRQGFMVSVGDIQIEVPRDVTIEEWRTLREAIAS